MLHNVSRNGCQEHLHTHDVQPPLQRAWHDDSTALTSFLLLSWIMNHTSLT